MEYEDIICSLFVGLFLGAITIGIAFCIGLKERAKVNTLKNDCIVYKEEIYCKEHE